MPYETLNELKDIDRSLSEEQPLAITLSEILSQITKIFEVEAISVLLLEEDGVTVYFKEATGPKGELLKNKRLQIGEGVAGLCIKDRKTIVINNVESDDTRIKHDIIKEINYAVHNIIGIPLITDGKILGALEILNNKLGKKDFDDTDVAIAELFAAQIAQLINFLKGHEERKKYIKELELTRKGLHKKISTLETLYELEQIVKKAETVQDALTIIIRFTLSVMNVEAGSILLIDEEENKLNFIAVGGEKEEQLRFIKWDISKGVVGWVYKNSKSVVTNAPYDDTRFDFEMDKKLGFTTRNLICVPLFFQNKAIGSFEVLNRKNNNPFNDEDEKMLSLIANQAANILTHLIYQREKARDQRLTDIGRVTGYIVHDIRNPLTTILAVPDVLDNLNISGKDKDLIFKLKEIIKKSTYSIMSLIDELLLFTRGKQGIEKELLNLKNFFNDILGELALKIKDSGTNIKIRLDFDPSADISYNCDAQKLKRVINNLVNNSIDALEKNDDGQIIMAIKMQEKELFFSLKDNGPGIPNDQLDKIFEPFYSTKKSKGTGLGLAIVKNIIELFDGSIKALPATDGAHFVITLPK